MPIKNNKLSIVQRILAVGIYIIIFLLICRHLSGTWEFLWGVNKEYNLLFVSGALLLIFGTYVAEPYFTKPVDVLTNSIAVVLALLSINNQNDFIGYSYIFYSSLSLALASIILIFAYQIFPKLEKTEKLFYEIIIKIGQSRVMFSVIYIATLFSYFKNKPIAFAFFVTFWIIFVTNYIVEGGIIWFSNILKKTKNSNEILGEALGCENPFLYKVEVDFFKHKTKKTEKGELVYLLMNNGVGVIGIIVNEKYLLNKKWITVYLLEHKHDSLKISVDNEIYITKDNTIFSKNNSVYAFDINSVKKETKELIESNYLYKNKDNFIGYVIEGSSIDKINFISLIDPKNEKSNCLLEGSVIKTKIYDQETLFQVIDGKTNEEELEKHSIYGYLIGVAQKLGKYVYDDVIKINKDTGASETIKEGELKVVKWLPDIYSPVFFDNSQGLAESRLSIGKLPSTNLDIILKDPDSLVTHNTAILGILGIGKSCLTFELIQKVVNNTEAKIICIDITNEYKNKLPKYIDTSLIQCEISQTLLDNLRTNNRTGNLDNPKTWGNEEFYKSELDKEFKLFSESEKRVLLLNPDWHNVSKAGAAFKINYKADLSIPEKTRIISERLFINAGRLADESWDEDEKNKARFLIVFEEAHSLIPEKDSASNSGDQSASNGTAKVILQGRKYGLGSLVVTQRTANISKSILNQCNTIFALRVFDDTGKKFLENYIGSNYSNLLSTLEERCAIVIGRALKLKQPVIVELNDKKNIILETTETESNIQMAEESSPETNITSNVEI